MDYFSQAGKLKKELKEYSYYNGIQSFFLSFYRINIGRINLVFKSKRYFKKLPQNGGRIFAFVGGDGAGKSTNIEKLRKILNSHFYTEVIHIGRPKKYLFGTMLRIIGRLARIAKISTFGRAMGLLAQAYDRKKSFERALKVRDRGGIVLLDRMPLKGIPSMDGPSIHTLENGRFTWMSKIEKKLHSGIKGVDELIVLRLDPYVAVKRRPEDGIELLKVRHGEIANKDFSKIDHAHEIDTSNSFDYIEESILKIVWQSISKKPLIYEILGLAGSGKSSMKEILDSRYKDLQFDINDINKKKGLFLIRKIPISIYIFYKTKNIMFPKAYLYLQVLLKAFTNHKITNHSRLLFDQGPIYIIAMLIREVPTFESYLFKELKKVLVHFDEIIYLEAPAHVLISRINTRTQEHEIKNCDDNTQREFIEEFNGIYKKILTICQEQGVKVTNINTEDNNLETVEKKIVNILDKDKNT